MPKLLSPRKFFPFSGPPHTFLILSSVKCSLQKFLVIVEERLKIKEAIIYRLPAIPCKFCFGHLDWLLCLGSKNSAAVLTACNSSQLDFVHLLHRC